MTLFDTHAHLDDDQFAADLPAVLERAAATGVAHVVTIATTAPSSATCVHLAARYSPLFSTVGIQPNHVAEAAPDAWDQVLRLVDSEKLVAVGETCRDRHWDYTPFPQEQDCFARHLQL